MSLCNPLERDTMPDSMTDLADLKSACLGCTNCDLAIGRSQVVFARGNPYSRIMVVGESPGAEEDACGEPFTGVSGQLLDRMFKAVGINTNTELYLSNTIRCRPPGNQNPKDYQTGACKPWLEDEIALLKPRFIIAAGGIALKWFWDVSVDAKVKITDARGKWTSWQHPDGTIYRVLPIFHPAYVIRIDADWDNPVSVHNRTLADMKTIDHARRTDEYINSSI